ncbi:cytochrome b/b6 domain-containing protein [Bradyrhizobium sp. BR13661]|jgi:thiosulfate reductase cytochrome b subunit|uniref:cytochrome b/b6 domain-containing protein n=2 Tax=Pseudomonadota TaxID=1224 RepID=UPI00247697E2|nr:cytochrome b/b6 domain-containing protein [Bradyrhizobium sp. BR13661]MDH6260249.1 thiosulfate reductase cytochrome b subunit [Bradyrhizobium sp. BR13661]
MSLIASYASDTKLKDAGRKVIHPRIVRITHWVNAVATITMITSGWQIYNASPIFPFRFPDALTLGGWLGGAIQWHFAAMWMLMLNGLIYLGYGVLSRRFYRKLWPIGTRALLADLSDALKGRLAHADLSTYNAVQKLLYGGVILAGIVAVLSGLAIWKPVQLGVLTSLFGDFAAARVVHFVAMSAISAFLVVHVAMALIVPASLLAMVRGR